MDNAYGLAASEAMPSICSGALMKAIFAEAGAQLARHTRKGHPSVMTATATPAVPAARPPSADLLRWATAGSVDDGKSTLVGRLLHDSKSVLADQLEAVERVSQNRGQDVPDLALLTDGLRAEREQGITIDVAYRYFATRRRRFILADTPGHVQYTRNMVTGASTADLAVILVDARHGVVEQTRRHAAIAALLRVPAVVLVVNKMDLVGYDRAVYDAVRAEFAAVAAELGVSGWTTDAVDPAGPAGPAAVGSPAPARTATAIPVCALDGDNVVTISPRMPWYQGPSLLDHLETVAFGELPERQPARFPVQYVVRHGDTRRYAGQLTDGVLRVGDRVTVLPTGSTTTVTAIDALGEAVDTGCAPQSLSLELSDDLDVGRGDLIAPAAAAPAVSRRLEAAVCHLHDRPLLAGDKVLLKHTSRLVQAVVEQVPGPDGLALNDIGRIIVRTAQPLAVDTYEQARRTGCFVLIDPFDGTTRSAGMVTRTHPGTGDGSC